MRDFLLISQNLHPAYVIYGKYKNNYDSTIDVNVIKTRNSSKNKIQVPTSNTDFKNKLELSDIHIFVYRDSIL